MIRHMELAFTSPGIELDNEIILISNKVKLPANRTKFFIAQSNATDDKTAFQCMLDGYVGFISESMTSAQEANEIYAVNEMVIKLLRHTGTSCNETDFRNDKVALIICEHFLNNSLIRNDENTFRHCLKLISQHAFTQRYPSIIKNIDEILGDLSYAYLSWFSVNETIEMLKNHIFFPANSMDKEQFKLLM